MLIDLAARLKFRWDLGQSFLSVAQFAVVIVAASDKLERVTGWSFVTVIAILLPAALASVMLLGYTLDKLGYWQRYQTLSNERNPAIKTLLERT
jgi:hypothetical protein